MNLSGKKLREWGRTLGFMAGCGALCVAALAAANQAAAGRIRANAEAHQRRAVLAAAGLADLPADSAALAVRFAELAAPLDGGRGGYRVGADIVVVPCSGIGLWGPIQAMVGIDRAAGRATGIAFLSHQETPGLGARIEEEWFLRQFRGLRLPAALASPAAPKGDDQLDAITGATITSAAVRDMVNAAWTE